MRLFKQTVAVIGLLSATVSGAKNVGDFGLGSVPQLGWSTWYTYGCDISAEKIKHQADLMAGGGLQEMGFEYILIDDCWQQRARNADNTLSPDPLKFPNGMKEVVDYIHNKSLKAGIYSSAGVKTCAGYPGSLGFEFVDAQQYADWGFDYLKYDNCHQTGESSLDRYSAMGNAINATGRDMFYAICNWGNEQVYEWAPLIAQSWRTTPDIQIGEQKGNSFFMMQSNFLQNQKSWTKAGPGGWNDPDMLLHGIVDDMTPDQLKTHTALWAMARAPMILSMDLANLGNVTNTSSIAGTLNHHLVKINQGKNGQQAQYMKITNSTGKNDTLGFYKTIVEQEDGDLYTALIIVNWYDQNITANAMLDFSAHGIALSRFDECDIMDLWTENKLTTNGGPHAFDTVGLEMHQHKAYKVKCQAF